MTKFGSISLLALTVPLVFGCKSTQPVQSAAQPTAQARVVESKRAEVPVTLQASGTLRAHQSAVLSAQVVGRVQQVLVHEGDFVKAGQTLVILDGATLKSTADQAAAAVKAAESQQLAAQTNADLAASTLARYRQLQAQKSVSPQEMDTVTRQAEAATAQVEAQRAQVNALKAQQSGAKTMLAYSRIVAPFAGVITARMADPGALASPGVPLLQIDSSGPLQLQASVSESAVAMVRLGMKLNVAVDALGSDLSGKVAEIVPASDPSSHSFLVKIDLPAAKQLRAGMYATAQIPTGTKESVVVPRSAIVMRGSLAYAYVVDAGNTAQLRYVTLGGTEGNTVEILSGIGPDEKLVDAPADRDLAGKRIEVQL